MERTNKVALITGANKGIGLETARQLGRDHGFTVLVGARDATRGEAAAQALRDEDLDAHFLLLDVTDTSSIEAAAHQVAEKFGHIDVLVNNAGVLMEWDVPPSQTPPAVLRATYEANVFGPVWVTQAFLPLLKKSQSGRIVNLSSILGSLADAQNPSSPFYDYKLLAYNSSKTALNGVTVAFAHELRDTPIKVNSVHPGYVDTDMSGHQGPMSVQDGARTSVELATIGSDGPSSGFFHLGESIAW
jgi:NAD(P)-dependent dehydrogenase (short-subunit alcohol dehydrogenase family)